MLESINDGCKRQHHDADDDGERQPHFGKINETVSARSLDHQTVTVIAPLLPVFTIFIMQKSPLRGN